MTDTTTKTLWSQSVFDSLFSAIEHGATDASIAELLKNLSDRGYTMDLIVSKVDKALGKQSASRIQRVALTHGRTDALRFNASQRASATARFRVSRFQRFKLSCADWWEAIDNGVYDAWMAVREHFERRPS